MTSQQPSVGKETPLAWNPLGPYPSGTEARSGGPGASSRRPAIVSVPEAIRHQPSFHSIDPSLSTKRESARITPPSPSPPTHKKLLPKAADDPKSRSPMRSGALPGFVTAQLSASAIVSREPVAAGAPVSAAVEGDGVGMPPTGDARAAALGLRGIAGEHAANVMLRSRTTAELLKGKPREGRIVSSSPTIYTSTSRPVPTTANVARNPTLRLTFRRSLGPASASRCRRRQRPLVESRGRPPRGGPNSATDARGPPARSRRGGKSSSAVGRRSESLGAASPCSQMDPGRPCGIAVCCLPFRGEHARQSLR